MQLSKADETRYPVQNMHGEIISYTDCRGCSAGSEPVIPCGRTIGLHTRVGDCAPCPNGTYSLKDDTKSCQKCKSGSCFEHQVILGKCEPKNDTTKCSNECDPGYKMNTMKTSCVVNKPDKITIERPKTNNSTTRGNITTPPTGKPPTPLSKRTRSTMKKHTTKEIVVSSSHKNKESLNVVIIIVIVIIVALAVVFFVYHKVIRPWIKKKKTNQGIHVK